MLGLLYLYLVLLLGFVPYRQILRTEFLHISLLEIVKVALLFTYVIKNVHLSTKIKDNHFWRPNTLNAPFAMIIASYLFSTLVGMLRQPMSAWNHVFRMGAEVVDYLLFFILMKELATGARIRQFVGVLLACAVIAAVFVGLFQLYPELLPPTSEMGVWQTAYGGFERIFTPGGALLFAASLWLLGYLLWERERSARGDKWLGLLLVLMLLAQIPSFIRSNFLIIIFWALILIARRMFSFRASAATMTRVGVVLGLMLVAATMIETREGDTLARALTERVFSVETIIRGEGELNTFQTRLLEARIAAQELRTWQDHLLGLGFGHVFYFELPPEQYEAIYTHNGYFSVYYSQGIVGLVLFFAFLAAVSHRLLGTYRLLRGSPAGRIQAGLVVVWLSHLVANWQAPLFQLQETIALIVISVVLSECLRRMKHERGAIELT